MQASAVQAAALDTMEPDRLVDWSAILAGGVAAVALSVLLLGFGAALGLSSVSPWRGEGLSATTIAIIAALWTVLVQSSCLAAGGYLAGRMRKRVSINQAEVEFRDGAHGFLVWAVTILLGAYLAGSVISGITRTAVSAAAGVTATAAAATGAVAAPGQGEELKRYVVDLLLRPKTGGDATAPVAAVVPQDGDREQISAAMRRTLVQGLSDGKLSPGDRAYLARAIATQTGLGQSDAEKRVDQVLTDYNRITAAAETKAKTAADSARTATLLTAFLTVASALVALVAAAAGAGLGGRHRDQRTPLRILGRERFW